MGYPYLVLILACFVGFSPSAIAVTLGDNTNQRIMLFNYHLLESRGNLAQIDATPTLEVLQGDDNDSFNPPGPSGLVSLTIRVREFLVDNTGARIVQTPWLSLKSNDIFDPATRSFNCEYGPSSVGAPCVNPGGPGRVPRDLDGWKGAYFGGGIADYGGNKVNKGNKGNKYIVVGHGFAATSVAPINGTTDHDKFKVYVVDMAGTTVLTKTFETNADGRIQAKMCVVQDYDGDGSDDLIIVRRKTNAAGTGQIRSSYVYDLITGVMKPGFPISWEVIRN